MYLFYVFYLFAVLEVKFWNFGISIVGILMRGVIGKGVDGGRERKLRWWFRWFRWIDRYTWFDLFCFVGLGFEILRGRDLVWWVGMTIRIVVVDLMIRWSRMDGGWMDGWMDGYFFIFLSFFLSSSLFLSLSHSLSLFSSLPFSLSLSPPLQRYSQQLKTNNSAIWLKNGKDRGFYALMKRIWSRGSSTAGYGKGLGLGLMVGGGFEKG